MVATEADFVSLLVNGSGDLWAGRASRAHTLLYMYLQSICYSLLSANFVWLLRAGRRSSPFRGRPLLAQVLGPR